MILYVYTTSNNFSFSLSFLSCIAIDTPKKDTTTTTTTVTEEKEDGNRESPSTSVPEPNNNESQPPRADREKPASALDSFNGLAASFISPFRPGRLAPIEILLRLFPTQRKAVLELVLQGCNGDLVKAIEHFLSAADTSSRHHGEAAPGVGAGAEGKQDGFTVPGMLPAGLRSPFGNDKHAMGSLKSAFTPLPPSSVATSLPLLFAPRPPHPFPTDALLGRTPLFAPSSVADLGGAGHPGGASARFAFPALHPLNLSGKFPTAAGESYPRLIFAPYGAAAATCPPDCVQCPGPRHSLGSESEKSPSATTEGSMANSNVDSD